MSNSNRTRALAAIIAIRKAFGAPGDYGYETAKGAALSNLYDFYNYCAAQALIANMPSDGEQKSLELRLAECLSLCIDTPLQKLRDIASGQDDELALYLASFKPEIAEQACALLDEVGL